MKSWDLFDTLIGRTCGTPIELFRSMAKEFRDPDFPTKRIAAERVLQDKRQEYSLLDIYESYADLNKISKQLARKYEKIELQFEIANVFPIKKYIDQVEDGDIVVSDMYLDAIQLKTLMMAAGIMKNVSIYVSCYGKHSNTIWGKLPIRDITLHTGDNYHNDVEKPMKFGIKTKSASTQILPQEQHYEKCSPGLGYWLRKERLSRGIEPVEATRLHFLQLEYNIPFLIASSHALYDYFVRKNLKKLLFMSRDGQMFIEVFKKLYPTVSCEYIYISRDCLQSNSKTFFSYLNKRLTADTALVDISASGGSLRTAYPNLKVKNPNLWTALFLKEPFKVDLGPIQMERIAINTETRCNNSHLERLNYADHWHVASVDADEKPVFNQQNEYDMSIVKKYHEFVFDVIKTIPTNHPRDIFGIVHYALQGINAESIFLKKTFPNHGVLEIKRRVTVSNGNSKAIIVGAVWGYEWNRISTWYKSIRCSNFDGDMHIIDLGLSSPTIERMQQVGIIVNRFDVTMRQNVVERFNALSELLEDIDPNTWVVFADCDDLVFQKNPSVYLKTVPLYRNIVVASEGVLFKDNEWTRRNLLSSFPDEYSKLDDKYFYNAGSIAARAKTFKELAKDIVLLCDTSACGSKHDQAAMNILLYSEKYKSQTQFTSPDDGWCFNGASSIFANSVSRTKYHGIPPRIAYGQCQTSKGIIPVMLHHYTRNKTVKAHVIARYSRG